MPYTLRATERLMDANAVIVAMFGGLVASFLGLFGWTLKQTNILSVSQAGLAGSLRDMLDRIDKLVIKLDGYFNIQISEQLARNVLQEKVRNLEIQLREMHRRGGPLRSRGVDREEENGE